jgi:hypothetical protein
MRTLISSCCLLVVLTFVAMAQNSASKAGKSKNLTAYGGPAIGSNSFDCKWGECFA